MGKNQSAWAYRARFGTGYRDPEAATLASYLYSWWSSWLKGFDLVERKTVEMTQAYLFFGSLFSIWRELSEQSEAQARSHPPPQILRGLSIQSGRQRH